MVSCLEKARQLGTRSNPFKLKGMPHDEQKFRNGHLWIINKVPNNKCTSLPIGSMYGIFTYIWLIFMVNVGKYTIHGSYGLYQIIPSFSIDITEVLNIFDK